jgi:hypothetical protein
MTCDEIDELPKNKKPYTVSAVRPAPLLLEPAAVLLRLVVYSYALDFVGCLLIF